MPILGSIHDFWVKICLKKFLKNWEPYRTPQIMAAIWIYYTRSRLASWAQEASKFQISWINHVFPQKCTARDRSSDPSHGSLKLYHWATEPIDAIWSNLVTFILLSKKAQNLAETLSNNSKCYFTLNIYHFSQLNNFKGGRYT